MNESLSRAGGTQHGQEFAREALPDAFWKTAVSTPFYRPIKRQLTVRLDADVLTWLRSTGREPHQPQRYLASDHGARGHDADIA